MSGDPWNRCGFRAFLENGRLRVGVISARSCGETSSRLRNGGKKGEGGSEVFSKARGGKNRGNNGNRGVGGSAVPPRLDQYSHGLPPL